MTSHKGNVLITGAGRRIGRHLALRLAEQGWSIAVHHNHAHEEAVKVVEDIKSMGGKAAAIQADLAQDLSTTALISAATATLGGPMTALINNASIFEHDSFETVTKSSWDRHLNINLRAPFFLSQSFAKALPKDQQGTIINIIDQRVWKLTPDYMSYTISKSALWTLTQTMAQALAPRIRVNAIGPGPVLKSIHQDEETFEKQSAALPMRQAATPDDVVQAATYLLDASSVTGQMIAVDGGQHLAWQTPDVVGVD
ncbi:MAG: SDR family oxidoreductase [Sphingomonadales bacterium]|jgi:NAD(P)-dependent dehydrogenase (short-subunit alcohol dehydrogenase family)